MNKKSSGLLEYVFIIFILFGVIYGFCSLFSVIPQMVDYAIHAQEYVSASATAFELTPIELRPTATPRPTSTPVPPAADPYWSDTYLNFPEGTEDVLVLYTSQDSVGYPDYTVVVPHYYCLIEGRYRECIPSVTNVSDEDN